MKLYHSPTSPFVRKVMAAAIELGLDGRIETVKADLQAPPGDFLTANPIARIPTLVLDDGRVLPESTLICAYLDSIAGNKLIPASGDARWRVLKAEALATAFCEAAVARRGEMGRAAGEQSPSNQAQLKARMERLMAAMEAEVANFGQAVTMAELATASACGYADFRFGNEDWRTGQPKLAAWYREFSKRPSIQRTVPPTG